MTDYIRTQKSKDKEKINMFSKNIGPYVLSKLPIIY